MNVENSVLGIIGINARHSKHISLKFNSIDNFCMYVKHCLSVIDLFVTFLNI